MVVAILSVGGLEVTAGECSGVSGLHREAIRNGIVYGCSSRVYLEGWKEYVTFRSSRGEA